ncbi:hypothetical protein BO83DRAFT_215620 [Aspergillus eucalypticola CBS 122712]|uniref:Uncharacterized protein n=1 Tax=Aspergillus eucalypticola (strain CBS 122712 / IBT 29274) TaxID=1448314 RepID=A0A317W111_ASPEC|nr:uncharacterized protein BO83DRAFT_215620 [Aspergillus eucalypticola CBS 122712]PWY78848.1 hypothetical protein BO83DRAFT_215620 [Aspergillus eucalypticola CBS 122712]
MGVVSVCTMHVQMHEWKQGWMGRGLAVLWDLERKLLWGGEISLLGCVCMYVCMYVSGTR